MFSTAPALAIATVWPSPACLPASGAASAFSYAAIIPHLFFPPPLPACLLVPACLSSCLQLNSYIIDIIRQRRAARAGKGGQPAAKPDILDRILAAAEVSACLCGLGWAPWVDGRTGGCVRPPPLSQSSSSSGVQSLQCAGHICVRQRMIQVLLGERLPVPHPPHPAPSPSPPATAGERGALGARERGAAVLRAQNLPAGWPRNQRRHALLVAVRAEPELRGAGKGG